MISLKKWNHNQEQANSQRQKGQKSSPGAKGESSGELFFYGYIFSLWDNENFLEMDNDDGCITV